MPRLCVASLWAAIVCHTVAFLSRLGLVLVAFSCPLKSMLVAYSALYSQCWWHPLPAASILVCVCCPLQSMLVAFSAHCGQCWLHSLLVPVNAGCILCSLQALLVAFCAGCSSARLCPEGHSGNIAIRMQVLTDK